MSTSLLQYLQHTLRLATMLDHRQQSRWARLVAISSSSRSHAQAPSSGHHEPRQCPSQPGCCYKCICMTLTDHTFKQPDYAAKAGSWGLKIEAKTLQGSDHRTVAQPPRIQMFEVMPQPGLKALQGHLELSDLCHWAAAQTQPCFLSTAMHQSACKQEECCSSCKDEWLPQPGAR